MRLYEFNGNIDFNPRSREGSDQVSKLTCGLVVYFNPRSREGSDHLSLILHHCQNNFNPRSREGSDMPSH